MGLGMGMGMAGPGMPPGPGANSGPPYGPLTRAWPFEWLLNLNVRS
jgi:hypothetical protein